MKIDEKVIEEIVETVVRKLSTQTASTAEEMKSSTSQAGVIDGVFEIMAPCIQAAKTAQKVLLKTPVAIRRRMIQHIRDAGCSNAEDYGRMEFEETGFGKAVDNVAKCKAACQVPGIEDLDPEVFIGDKGATIIERVPVGVIASIHPVTNAVPSILFNAVMMIAGGNTVVVNAHPKTKVVSVKAVRELNRAIVSAGGPPNCICCLIEPSVPSAQELMTHKDIGMIAVTGGHGVVDFATKTGKRVIAGGPGNPPVVVDETADIDRAARCIVDGAGFSNCTACASEKEIFVVESVADQLKESLKKQGAYELTAEQGAALVKHIFNEVSGSFEPSVINMDYIGKTPAVILKSIGLDVGDDVKIVILEADRDHPLVWTEQIMPVLPIVRCPDVDHAVSWALAAEQDMGHSMAIHSNSLKNIEKMASQAYCASFIKNGACGTSGVGITGEGFVSFHIATNGEGHTRPRTFTRIRRCVMTDDLRYRYGTDQ
jgi:propionaldehyde dehydrogenase